MFKSIKVLSIQLSFALLKWTEASMTRQCRATFFLLLQSIAFGTQPPGRVRNFPLTTVMNRLVMLRVNWSDQKKYRVIKNQELCLIFKARRSQNVPKSSTVRPVAGELGSHEDETCTDFLNFKFHWNKWTDGKWI
jgi:hypothetical protein